MGKSVTMDIPEPAKPHSDPPHFHVFDQNVPSGPLLKVSGIWTSAHIRDLAPCAEKRKYKNLTVDATDLTSLDTSGAATLYHLLSALTDNTTRMTWQGLLPRHKATFELVSRTIFSIPPQQNPSSWYVRVLTSLGENIAAAFAKLPHGIAFLGLIIVSFVSRLCIQRHFRLKIMTQQLTHTGIGAAPIVSLISFLIGIVLAFQGASQLRRFGAEVFTVDLLAVGVLREIGVLLTAIVVAGRSGSAFSAQIGTMKLNHEIDALRVMGLHEMDILILPRIVALMIALPLLTFLANCMAMAGGSLMAFLALDISYQQFVTQLQNALTPWTFWIGMIKAPIFAFLIAIVGCYEGLQVQGSAESLGLHTTKSVVEGIFLIIVCDAAFSIFFSFIGV